MTMMWIDDLLHDCKDRSKAVKSINQHSTCKLYSKHFWQNWLLFISNTRWQQFGRFKNWLSGKNLHLNLASTKVPTDSPSKNLQVLPSRSISAQAARFSIGSFLLLVSGKVYNSMILGVEKKQVSKVYHLIISHLKLANKKIGVKIL